MKTRLFSQLLLALHIIGLIIMAGSTLIDYITYKTFWKLADLGNKDAAGLLPLMSKYGLLVRTGAAVLILTGIGLLALSRWVWGEQWWFRIKIALVVMLILNGILAGNRQGLKLRKLIGENGPDFMFHAAAVREQLDRFYLIQLALFVVITLVSVIRFD